MSAEECAEQLQDSVIFKLKLKRKTIMVEKPESLKIDADFTMIANEKKQTKNIQHENNATRKTEMMEKPNRFKVDADYMNLSDLEEQAENKHNYGIIDLHPCQPCNCTFDKPCRQTNCWQSSTIHYNDTHQDNLYTQLQNLKQKKDVKPFTYSFNSEMYSGSDSINEIKPTPMGKGGFGEVFKFYDIKTKCSLVRKKIKKGSLHINEVIVPIHFPNEINLVRLLGCFYDREDFYIIQECAGNSLLELSNSQEILEYLKQPLEILLFSSQLFTGVNSLAKRGITHCDLKPQNVCLQKKPDNTFLVKLIDFGSCRTDGDHNELGAVTAEYLPPDFLRAYSEAKEHQAKESAQNIRSLNAAVDVWAGGLIILFIYKGKHPMVEYFEKKRSERIKLICQLSDPLDGYFTTSNRTVDILLSNVLVVNSGKRWAASDILVYLKDKLQKFSSRESEKTELKQKQESSFVDVDIKRDRGERQTINHMDEDPRDELCEQSLGVILKYQQQTSSVNKCVNVGQNLQTPTQSSQIAEQNLIRPGLMGHSLRKYWPDYSLSHQKYQPHTHFVLHQNSPDLLGTPEAPVENVFYDCLVSEDELTSSSHIGSHQLVSRKDIPKPGFDDEDHCLMSQDELTSSKPGFDDDDHCLMTQDELSSSSTIDKNIPRFDILLGDYYCNAQSPVQGFHNS